MHTVPAFLKENPVIYDGFPLFSEWGKYENLNNGYNPVFCLLLNVSSSFRDECPYRNDTPLFRISEA